MVTLDTPEQLRRYLAAAFETDRAFTAHRCEYGWVCQRILTEDEIAAGLGFGQGNYVVDRSTGVITAHSSLHPITIGEQYDAAVRSGEPVQGHRVYPPSWEIHYLRHRDTDREIEYRIWAPSLLDPPAEQPVERQVTIDKHTFRYHADTEAIHVTCGYAVAWLERQSRIQGQWPETGMFRA